MASHSSFLENATMAILLPDSRALSDDVMQALRLRALHAREHGFTEEQIADILGLSRETISRWWTAYSHGGLEAIPQARTGRPEGSGRTLTPDQEQHLQHLLDTAQPQDLDIAAPLWTRPAVAQLILKECQIDMPLRTVGLYLKRWGYAPKRPRRKAAKQVPAEVQEWLEQTYPAVAARATKEGADIWWEDETGLDADEYRGRGYARRGQAPEKEVSGDRRRVNVVSAITADGDVQFQTYRGTMTGAVFLAFLIALVVAAPRKMVLVVDRLRAHLTPEVMDWLADHQRQIELVVLPRYAPELNAEEYLNNDLKEEVNAQGLPSGMERLRANVEGFLERLKGTPERVMSYFCHPDVQYASHKACD
jgi:transposase